MLVIYNIGVIFTKTARTITLVLASIAEVICCLGLNSMGAYAFISNGYEKCGYALILSTIFLLTALISAILKKVLIPFILNILGSGGYIYALAILSAIPNTKIPTESIERLMANHYPTAFVTVFLIVIIFFNYFSKEAVEKRAEKRKKEIFRA